MNARFILIPLFLLCNSAIAATPSEILARGAAFQALSDKDLQVCQVTLLNNMGTNALGGTNQSRALFPNGIIRIGTNVTDLTQAQPGAIFVGQFVDLGHPTDPLSGTFVFGDGIYIGGGNGGEAYTNSVSIGSGAGSGGFGPTDLGAIGIGHQTDSFGNHSIGLGFANASLGGQDVIQIGGGASDGGFTNTITVGNSPANTIRDNMIALGDGRTTKVLLRGSLFSSNQNTAAFTIVNTNFVQGLIYSNAYGAPILVVANILLTSAAQLGDVTMDLQQPAGTLLNRVGTQTTGSSLAITNEINLVGSIPPNTTYAITNTITTGTGNAVFVIGGQILVY